MPMLGARTRSSVVLVGFVMVGNRECVDGAARGAAHLLAHERACIVDGSVRDKASAKGRH